MKKDIDFESLKIAIQKKAEERKTLVYLENVDKYLKDIKESEELNTIWESYSRKFPYAEGIQFSEITNILVEIFNM
ncbi:hypothetical protein [Fusibacter ferrireducens]|uniref:Uncharacterized protein n=1 Tax=Fusibacter ferrireducens TaxID=2785058 RepID=A0ABR9ZXF9_9FIRM|nr:hypothetical protein [Fusibacter ferrireducens]MBF4695150.1 hypothetical protein [Fusibacter ferrireducens]